MLSVITKPSATVTLPVPAPKLRALAAPPTLSVVAVVFTKLNVVWLVVKSPPSTLTSPSTSKLLLTLVVPEAAPNSNVVAAPPILSVVAVVLIKLNVVWSVPMSPPPTNKSLATPRPPAVNKEPVVGLVESVALVTLVTLLRSQLVVACTYVNVASAPSTVIPAPSALAESAAPLAITMFLSVTVRSVELTFVSVPLTVKLPVTTASPPTFRFLATPTPPSTINAPVVAFVDCVVLLRLVAPVTSSVPPTCKFSATPRPPATFKAPVVELVEVVVASTLTAPSNSDVELT